MSSNPTKLPLSDLLELIIDHRGKTPNKQGFDDFFPAGVPVLSAKHVKTDVLVDVDSMRYASPEMYKKWMAVEVQEGDIILTSEAPMGEVFYIKDDQKYVLGQRVFGLRPNRELINPKYLAAWLASSEGQRQLIARASGSTVQGIRQSELLKLEIDLPSAEEQARIANIRFSIADKVNLNRRINQTLEAIAQAIFKSWFVDFDPVKAKIAAMQEGRDPLRAAMSAISGKPNAELNDLPSEYYEQLAATAALFPDAMEDSALGDAPKGWEVSDMRSLSEVISKGTTPSKADLANAEDEPIVPFIKVKDISQSGEVIRGGLELIAKSIHKNSLKRSILKEDDLLFSIAGTIGRTAYVDCDLHGANTNQAVAFIRLRNKPDHFPLCWLTLRSRETQNFIVSKVVQAVQANASLLNVGDIPVILPGDDLVTRFNLLVAPLIREYRTRQGTARVLANLRDTLLPKLLSGELGVEVHAELTGAK